MYAYNRTHITVCIALMTSICGHAVGGDINPPPGAIAPTMKSLDRIEPRICVNDLPGSADGVHVITEPGNYYLAADIIGEPGKSGIMIVLDDDSDDDNISISMDGFDLIGVPGSHNGIDIPLVANVRVERFNVKQEFGPTTGGTRGWGGAGVSSFGATECTISNLNIEDNGGPGIVCGNVVRFKAGADLSKKVNVAGNGGGGIIVSGCPDTTLAGLNVSQNIGTGVEVTLNIPEQGSKKFTAENISCNNNTGDGLVLNQFASDDMTVRIRRASMDANAGDGMRISGIGDESLDMDMSIDELYVGHNGGHGANIHAVSAPSIRVSITDSTFATNVLSGLRIYGEEGARIREVRATRCSSSENGGSGFETLAGEETYTRCVANDNIGNGFLNQPTPSSLRPLDPRAILKSYFETSANRNGGNGIETSECTVVVNVCHLISNGGNGGDITDGDVSVFGSSFLDNGGSGLRTNDSPLYTENTTCGENVLYGVHSSGNGGTNTTTIKDSVVRSNGSGGIRKEGGHYCGETNHLISNGGGGGGTGSGLGLIDVASAWVQGTNSTGNTGAGVALDSSSSGISPISCRFDKVNASGNGGDGMSMTGVSFAQLTACLTNSNGGSGLFAPSTSSSLHIEGCVASGNASSGIDLTTGLGHILVNNAAAGNPLGGYRVVGQGNTVGPQVDEGGVIQNGNPGGNYVR